MNWKQANWLCLDVETTGLDPASDRIVEIGAVGFCEGKLGWQMNTMIDPGIPIPAEATAIHGITDAAVSGNQSIDDAWPELADAIRWTDALVGYNWPFDSSFFEATSFGPGWSKHVADRPIIDPLVIVRTQAVGRYWKGKGRHKLDAVARHFNIPREGDAHRAVSDCVLTCRVLWELRDHLPDDAELASASIAQLREKQDADFARYKARVG